MHLWMSSVNSGGALSLRDTWGPPEPYRLTRTLECELTCRKRRRCSVAQWCQSSQEWANRGSSLWSYAHSSCSSLGRSRSLRWSPREASHPVQKQSNTEVIFLYCQDVLYFDVVLPTSVFHIFLTCCNTSYSASSSLVALVGVVCWGMRTNSFIADDTDTGRQKAGKRSVIIITLYSTLG